MRAASKTIADIDYMPTVRLTTHRGSDSAVIKVWDNGDGIPEDVAKKIFEPFFTTKPTDKGTGLGLAMSNDIVSSHGGTIVVWKAHPGEYTEFTITLPLAPYRAVGNRPRGRMNAPADG